MQAVIEVILAILLVILAGIMDRLRGDEDIGVSWQGKALKTADALLYGAIVGYLAFGLTKDALYLAVAVVIAISISYKNPWGAVTGKRDMGPGSGWSWWEQIFTFAKDNKHAGLIVRGLIGAFIVGMVCIPRDVYAPVVGMFCGFAVAPYLGAMVVDKNLLPNFFRSKFNLYKPGKERWNVSEFVRGVIVSAVSAVRF